MPDETPKAYDVFISHASEDKEEVARPLAQELQRLGLAVWLDEFKLTLGDSLRQEIDRGLIESRFGVVILSPNFFRKEWTSRELDALIAIEGNGKVILPVWHHLTKEQVVQHSPLLAGKLAVSTEKGIPLVANAIFDAINQYHVKRYEDSAYRFWESRSRILDDYCAKKISDIRRKLFVAKKIDEIKRLEYEAEEFLASFPNNVEGKLLIDDIRLSRISEFTRSLRPTWLKSPLDRFSVMLRMPGDVTFHFSDAMISKYFETRREKFKRSILIWSLSLLATLAVVIFLILQFWK